MNISKLIKNLNKNKTKLTYENQSVFYGIILYIRKSNLRIKNIEFDI